MPVTASVETTGYIFWNAWADDTDKGSPGAGDGLTQGTAFDTLEAALAGLTGITPADVSITRPSATSDETIFDVEFVGALAATDMEDVSVNSSALSGFTSVIEMPAGFRVQGAPGINEQFRVRLLNPGGAATDWFRLERLSLTGRQLQVRMTQRWLSETILADGPMTTMLGGTPRVYFHRVPPGVLAARPPLCILIESGRNSDIQAIGGVHPAADHEMRLIAMAPQDAPGERIDMAAQRLSELFADDQNTTLPDGWMLSCQRHEQIDDPKPDASDQQWQRLGIGVYVVTQQTV